MKETRKIKITFLGTAANGGIPQVDCRCKNCNSKVSMRKRSSILIEINNKKMIIDCGPDFHSQLIENNLRLQDLSGIVISHLHWDHCSGLFELASGRVLKVPVVVPKKIKDALRNDSTFNFIFNGGWAKFSKPDDIKIEFIKIEHDPKFPTFAITVSSNKKSILIATDIWRVNSKFIKEAKKANLVIFDSTFLNESKHWHISVKESAPILTKLNKKAIFTHINHSENPGEVQEFLKGFGFKLAFDGMVIKI